MGIYLFNTPVLLELLTARPLATDFGKEVFPRNYQTKTICAHLFDGYWEDLGTIRSYHEASLALAEPNPPFDFFAPEGVIYTRMRNLPASRMDVAELHRSLVADGCVVGQGSRVERCILGGAQPGRARLHPARHRAHRVGRVRDRRPARGEQAEGRPGPEHRRRAAWSPTPSSTRTAGSAAG
jgi:hypothetical protein